MMTTTDTAITVGRAHNYVPAPCTCDDEFTCNNCTFGIEACTICRLDNCASRTTHCPGKLVPAGTPITLIQSAIDIGRFDFVGGTWVALPEEHFRGLDGTMKVCGPAGSVDNLVAYANDPLSRRYP